nr:hypothetical protein [Saprospiraceae bacterium]
MTLFLTACNKDKDLPLSDSDSTHNSYGYERSEIFIDDNYDGLANDAQMILGDSIPNPYNVNRMQQAFDLFNQEVLESPFSEKVVTATHHYVKIVLNTYEDLQILYDIEENEGVNAPIFFMHPLHLEIIQHGDYYNDLDSNEIFVTGNIDMSKHPIYTVIETNYSLPSILTVETLDDLYKPSHEEHIVKLIAYQLAGWNTRYGGFGLPDSLSTLLEWVGDYPEFEGIYPEDWEPDPPQPPQPGSGFSTNNTHGRITLQSTHPTNNNEVQPVTELAIKYGRYVWWFRTQTTENDGWFSAHKKYSGDVYIRADWRYNTSTASIRERLYEKLGFFVSDHLMKIPNGSSRRIKFISYTSDREHVWNKATIHTGIHRYNQYCVKYGIDDIVNNSIIWSMDDGTAASNPMLNRMFLIPALSVFMNLSEIDTWTALQNHMMTVPINLIIQFLPVQRPDQIYGLQGNRRRTERLHQVVFHECAHFSHALQAGQNYWAKVYSDQFINGIHTGPPRGNGVQP